AVGDPAKLLAVCFALLRGGVATAPVNVNMPPQLIANDIHTLICDDPNLMLAGGRTIRFDDSWLRRKDQQPLSPSSLRASRAMGADLIFFTSGTTGTPKKNVTPSAALMERIALMSVSGESY